MVLKTFNIDENIYKKFSAFCKNLGISMSKQIEFFMESFISNDKQKDDKIRKKYLKELEKIRKGKFMKLKSFAERYNIK